MFLKPLLEIYSARGGITWHSRNICSRKIHYYHRNISRYWQNPPMYHPWLWLHKWVIYIPSRSMETKCLFHKKKAWQDTGLSNVQPNGHVYKNSGPILTSPVSSAPLHSTWPNRPWLSLVGRSRLSRRNPYPTQHPHHNWNTLGNMKPSHRH